MHESMIKEAVLKPLDNQSCGRRPKEPQYVKLRLTMETSADISENVAKADMYICCRFLIFIIGSGVKCEVFFTYNTSSFDLCD